MIKFSLERLQVTILLLGVLSLCACSKAKVVKKEDGVNLMNQQPTVSLDVPPPPPPPRAYYFHSNFIITPTGDVFYHHKEREAPFICGTGLDYDHPPFIGLTPDKFRKIPTKGLSSFLDSLLAQAEMEVALEREAQESRYGKEYDYLRNRKLLFMISSPSNFYWTQSFFTITNFAQNNRLYYGTRTSTEEERVVLDAKSKGIPYDSRAVNWKEEFGGTSFTPPTDTIEE